MQADLFKEQAPSFPDGFRYSPNVVPAVMQADLVRLIKEMPLKPFDFMATKASGVLSPSVGSSFLLSLAGAVSHHLPSASPARALRQRLANAVGAKAV
ncbi:hypothetical protein [Neorhizobium galegae]|uniref:Uncharacterized protein n=1 Tax=Neorhizobium galegae bv. orientalis str. HAMBI 540 TaxID=1028800 RepID=A0A068T0L6_NEOGA|nr:hypothetical protein [Neorhizobium galegae]MCQ1853377.1 hypothetical protein [Neorhizobium galegae]CDN51987.1 Hypothetical protein RG540_PA13110 [Neorhizobium galegae bv. orientalis str. HAMBI 540]CDZ53095.1 Hypothetical protein NGAL_HAMBI2427_49820 [Neorhizobium galegae bv. orientalis]